MSAYQEEGNPMTNEETSMPQPAPSPATIHVPPGAWTVTVTSDEGNVVATQRIEGPTNLKIAISSQG